MMARKGARVRKERVDTSEKRGRGKAVRTRSGQENKDKDKKETSPEQC